MTGSAIALAALAIALAIKAQVDLKYLTNHITGEQLRCNTFIQASIISLETVCSNLQTSLNTDRAYIKDMERRIDHIENALGIGGVNELEDLHDDTLDDDEPEPVEDDRGNEP